MWPTVYVYLCCWHVKRARLKNLCNKKLGDKAQQAKLDLVFEELSKVMAIRARPAAPANMEREVRAPALPMVRNLQRQYAGWSTFWAYFDREWLPKMGELREVMLRLRLVHNGA